MRTTKENKKISKGALCFTEKDSLARVESFKEGEVEEKRLIMEAYSGKIIKDHWYWGDLAIDTSGMSIPKSKMPILHDHDTSQKIGFGKFSVDKEHRIVNEKATFVDTPIANEFIQLSGQGFPYQASIRARPSEIVRLSKGEVAEVNGYSMKGPGTVWRKSVLIECSVCTFGADSNTKSVAMSENEDVELVVEQAEIKQDKEVPMKLDAFKAENPGLFNEIVAIGKSEAEQAFVSIKTDLEKQITTLTADKESLTALSKETTERIQKLEKAEDIRKEREIKATADAIVATALSAQESIPARLHPKIRKNIDHEKFVKDDVLDKVAFAAAVTVELSEWLPKEGEDGESSILGMATVKNEGLALGDSDAMVARMLASVGQKTEMKH
jgi:hypothetical protein